MDLGETMFCGARKVQGVGGANVGAGGSGSEYGFKASHHGLGEWQKVNEKMLAVIVELLREAQKVLWRVGTFASFAQENRSDFGSPVPGNRHRLVGLCQQLFDRYVPRFGGIDPEQVSAVKVEHLRGRTDLLK